MKKLFIVFMWLVMQMGMVGQSAKCWQNFIDAKKNGNEPLLPDYSYAGYKNGEESIPEATGKMFDVTDFGAVPNDGKSDRVAIEAAIKAASVNGGIVFFPKGRFLVNEASGNSKGIKIQADNVILKGAGADSGGTEIFMKHHLEPNDPKKKWSTPTMFSFSMKGSRARRKMLTEISTDTRRESFKVTVKDSTDLRPGMYVMLEMRNVAANDAFLDGMKPFSFWKTTVEQGVQVRGEKHRIKSVDGNVVTFYEPIHCDIDASHGWSVKSCPFAKGWGVEDIHFRGNFKIPFEHHKNAMHDSGWCMLSITRGLFPFVRRCRFTDVTGGVSLGACYGGTIINCEIDGNRGHTSFESGYYSYGNLIAFCKDNVSNGTFHGIGIKSGAVGTVVYRCENSKRGFDWHGSWPYCSLIDACSGGLIGNGGNFKVLPNHMKDLTFWNFKQTSVPEYDKWDWWKLGREGQMYSGAKVVKPNLIGFHGIKSTFLEKHCGIIESHGKAVKPDSLYEAQLKARLEKLPEWIADKQQR